MLKTKCLVLGKWPASRRLTSNTSKTPPAVQRAATTSPSNPSPPHHPPPSSTAVQRAATTSHQPPHPLNSSQGFWPHFSIELQILCLDQPLQWKDINKGEVQFCVKTSLIFSYLCMQALLFPSISYASQLQFILCAHFFFFYSAGWWLWGWEEWLLPYQIDVQDIQGGFAGTFEICKMFD